MVMQIKLVVVVVVVVVVVYFQFTSYFVRLSLLLVKHKQPL